jgi:acetolactate synthase-1/2/3 large subunit
MTVRKKNIGKRVRCPGAQLLLELMKKEGVTQIFGYPGGSVIPFYDALYDFTGINHTLVRHEQGAAHAADGYARATGRPGVCVATSGPGATNLVTGLATAYADSIPVVAITGQVKSMLIGNDAFQEADVTGITRPITKLNYLVKNVNDLPRVMKEAFYLATTGRQGPVLVDVPLDVSLAEFNGSLEAEMDLPGYAPRTEPDKNAIAAAAEAINAAERPVFYVGGGCVSSDAWRELRACVKAANVPVVTTIMGKGVFPENDPLCLGMLGMHGTAYANYAVHHCDLLIAVGARFDDRITGRIEDFTPLAKRIHFDIDPTCIGKNVRTDLSVVGDARKALSRMRGLLRRKERKSWFKAVGDWRRRHPLFHPNNGLRVQYVLERLNAVKAEDALVVTDVGQHQMWSAQFCSFQRPRSFLTSGGLGTMGFGLPAAIGAQFGRPDAQTWLVTGDGSIMMNIQELVTAAREKLPLKILVMNNAWLGMVRQWQQFFWRKRYSFTQLNDTPDLVRLAEAFNCRGLRCEHRKDVDATLRKALAVKDAPVVVDFRVAAEENVYPMVPAGKAVDEMIFYPKDPELV